MVSNSQNPYKVIEENPFDYSFVSRDGINYHLYFTPISSIYPDLDYELLLSIYFRKDNPYKQQLIKAFGDLLSQNYYEIVV